MVDLVELQLLLNGFFGELFMFFYVVLLFLQLLLQQFDPVLQSLSLFSLFLQLIFLVHHRYLGSYLVGLSHLLYLIYWGGQGNSFFFYLFQVSFIKKSGKEGGC